MSASWPRPATPRDRRLRAGRRCATAISSASTTSQVEHVLPVTNFQQRIGQAQQLVELRYDYCLGSMPAGGRTNPGRRSTWNGAQPHKTLRG